MNNEIDAAAQEDPEWVLWSSPQRIQAAIDQLFTETLPQVPAGRKTFTGEVVGPMPQADRYSDEMALHWIADIFDYFLPDADALIDNVERADQWVSYVGEYFVQHCKGRWVNVPRIADEMLYRFGPAIAYDWTDSLDFPVDVLYSAVEEQDFSVVTDGWYDRAVEYAEVHDLTHEARELRTAQDG